MIRSLQSWRFICAVLIFIHHFGFEGKVVESFGDFAVSFFMMLSGFVLTYSYLKKHKEESGERVGRETWRFMRGRVIQIYPTYFLALVFAIGVGGWHIWPVALGTDVLMAQSWVPVRDVFFSGNSPAWFISTIMGCYALFVPIMRMARRHPAALKWLAAIYFVAYFAVTLSVSEENCLYVVYICPLMQLSAFVIGMWLGRNYLRMKEQGAKAPAWLPYAAVMVMIVAMMCYGDFAPRFTLCCYWWAVSGLLIWSMAMGDGDTGKWNILMRALRSRAGVAAGDASMCYYLLHLPFIKLMRQMEWVADMPLLWQAVLLGAVLVPVSMALRRYFELPISRALRGSRRG